MSPSVDRLLTVLADISDNSKLVKVASTTFCAERFFESDLNVADIVLVQGRIKENVAETENERVLDHLFTEVVVDSVRLVFGPFSAQSRHHLSTRLEVFSEWLFDDDTVAALFRVDVLLQSLGDDGEDGRRESHVEDSVGLVARTALLQLFNVLEQRLVSRVLVVWSGDVRRNLLELLYILLKLLGGLRVVLRGGKVAGLSLVELLVVHFCL